MQTTDRLTNIIDYLSNVYDILSQWDSVELEGTRDEVVARISNEIEGSFKSCGSDDYDLNTAVSVVSQMHEIIAYLLDGKRKHAARANGLRRKQKRQRSKKYKYNRKSIIPTEVAEKHRPNDGDVEKMRRWYSDYYLRCAHWKKKRRETIADRGHVCEYETCGEMSKLHVHHLSYGRLFFEKPEDLMVLCEDHHNDIHRKPSKRKYNWPEKERP